MNVIDGRSGKWPEAVSDGLTLPCAYCKVIPNVDWHTSDEEWHRIIPKRYRLGVICLACFIGEGGDPRTVEQIQVVVPGCTFIAEPSLAVIWGGSEKP